MSKLLRFGVITIVAILVGAAVTSLEILATLGADQFITLTPVAAQGTPLAQFGLSFLEIVLGCSGLLIYVVTFWVWVVGTIDIFRTELKGAIGFVNRIRISMDDTL